uniref:Uncharacterized protein n=1 Tax=Geospiza parvula TaxID=87175 RepID=A0A8C3MY57_GEOPR
MGNQPSKDINMKTPLGCILKHWKDLGGIPGGNVSKKTLLKYCTQWWPLYKLDDGEKWPPEGTINYNTVLQLMLFLRWLNKWDEVMYADMFFTLRNKPEWQKECGINVAPQDPLVLALEKDKKVGKELTEIDGEGEEQEKGKRKEKRKNREDIEGQEDPGEGTSHSYYTRSVARREAKEKEEGNHTIAPLRQVMPIVGERGRVKVPFSTSGLNNWRDEARNFRRNPEGVAKRFELMAKNLDIDWEDIEVMLSELTDTERELVLKTGRQHAEVLIPSGRRIEDIFPSSKPEWDPSNGDHYNLLEQYRRLIAAGLRNAIPKAINWSMLYDIRQGKDETPSEFLDRLRAAMRQYTPLDPSNPDIRKKLQKLEHPENKNLETLLNEAWKVYNNREIEEKKKEDRRINTNHSGPGIRGRGRGNPARGGGRLQPHPARVGPNQCAYCLKMGHWKRECPQLRERLMGTTTATHQDSE